MSHCFIITSAINTKFGVFDGRKRLEQTLETIQSIRARVSDVVIVIIEMSAIPLSIHQKSVLSENCNFLIEYSGSDFVKEIFKSDNWDVVKNLTEVACFRDSLKILRENNIFFAVERIYKISGRYKLNNNFNINTHNSSKEIILSKSRQSQFNVNLTGVHRQYMSRLWSWPSSSLDLITEAFNSGFEYMLNRIENGGYCDIEHMLYAKLNQFNPKELDLIGVEGFLGPNGILVND